MRRAVLWTLAIAAVASAYACATGTLTDEKDGSVGDATSGDGGACPQYDLATDPQHCGSCTNACGSGMVCSSGSCKSSCQSPTTKCTGTDGGVTCANLTSDTNHCGGCTKTCTAADGGGIDAGTNNPVNPGVIYDSGVGWTTGSASCDASACATVCSQGFAACSDGICYDTQNHHDHCGTCSTACASQEWCNRGNCCALGQEYCNGSCVDVLSNNANCGACGNACSGSTPNCANGVCSSTCTPAGTRQAYNTLQSKSATGCLTTSPCATATYNWASTNIQSFYNVGEYIVCSGTTACISHVGINNWSDPQACQGSWDVYCDSTKVGTLNTVGKTCSGSPMSNNCSISFSPVTCSTIKLQVASGNTNACCGGTHQVDTSIAGVTAW
jgi:hypothetical protein